MTNFDEMDLEAFLNMRDWFHGAVEAYGGKVIDSGMGGGRADLGVEIDGHEFSLWITPRSQSLVDTVKERLADPKIVDVDLEDL